MLKKKGGFIRPVNFYGVTVIVIVSGVAVP